MFQLTVAGFVADKQGRKFWGVVEDPRLKFPKLMEFFNSEARQVRMEDSEMYHDRPALAGVIKELESDEWFGKFFSNYDAHTTYRARQAIGVITRLIMEARGWHKTGTKGALGQRGKVEVGDTTPGAYQNKSGLSRWFTRAERYKK